jgi:hypothetical protein
MELAWFLNELEARTRQCDFPPLVTTATDGDNGGWFRNPQPEANFWGLYQALMDQTRAGGRVRPTFIDDYLDQHGAHGEVTVGTGAWNTGWHHGHGFLQWTGSQTQRDALARLTSLSAAVHDTRLRAGELGRQDPETQHLLEQAMWRLLRAETSCHFYWGEAWVPRALADMQGSEDFLEQARARLQG